MVGDLFTDGVGEGMGDGGSQAFPACTLVVTVGHGHLQRACSCCSCPLVDSTAPQSKAQNSSPFTFVSHLDGAVSRVICRITSIAMM